MDVCIVGLEKEMRDIISTSVTKNTKNLYKKYWSQFRYFCKDLALPLNRDGVVKAMELWIAALGKEGVSYGSILCRLSALRHYIRKSGKNISLTSHRLELMLKGLRKRRKPVKSKNPVTISHIKRLHKVANRRGHSTALMLKAMTTLAFFGFLRPSEFCISKSNHYLRRADVKFGRGYKCGYIRLRTFKHSTVSKTVKVDEQPQGPVRPIKALKDYLNDRPDLLPKLPLFDMTVLEFSNVLKELCLEAGIKTHISPHCFRVGGATWASSQGWSEARIQKHGRWNSGAYKTYIKDH